MSTCPDTCADCGTIVEEWDSSKTYTCCECVSKNGKTYRVKKGVATTTQDPEGTGMTDWVEIVTQVVESAPLAPGTKTKEGTTTTFGGWGIFFFTILVLFLIGALYYLFFRTPPEIEARANKVDALNKDLLELESWYPRAMVYLAMSKNNAKTYLDQPIINELSEMIKAGRL